MASGVWVRDVAEVEVVVGRLTLAGRDAMGVDVDRRARHEREVGQAALLGGLAQSGVRRVVLVGVAVPADLQPPVELGVMGEQQPPRRVEHEGRAGDVPERVRAAEAILVGLGEGGDVSEVTCLIGVGGAVLCEHLEQSVAVGHAAGDIFVRDGTRGNAPAPVLHASG